jgi:hypothetical protein
MGPGLGNGSQIGNIHRSAKACLVRGIEEGIQRNVLENLVDSQLVRIKDHLDLCSMYKESRETTTTSKTDNNNNGTSEML